MFDFKSLLQRGVEKELLDVDDYIFMPERIEMMVEEGALNCVLNSDGRVNIFYTKEGVTEVSSAARKHPFTSFEKELHHGIYDDIIEDLVKEVHKIINGHSKYFVRKKILPSSGVLTQKSAPPLKPT